MGTLSQKTMKKIFTIFVLCICSGLFAQHKVAEKITELQSQNATFSKFTVLTASSQVPAGETQRAVDKATFAKINMAAINTIVANKYETIEIAFPYQGTTVSVSLYKADLFNENFHLDTDKSRNIAYEKGVYYRGIINGDLNSVASFSFFNGQFNGIASSSALNNLVVGRLERENNQSDYIVYSDANMKVPNGFSCGVKEETHKHDQNQDNDGRQDRGSLTERCVTMYFEIDHNLYLYNSSDTTQTTNWMTSVFNNVQTLYENDGMRVSLKSLYIWTEQDPYFGNSSQEYLYMFNDVTPVFDGDVGQLIGIDDGGLGGVAVTIDGLCSQENFSYSDVSGDYLDVPTYSWTVQVITHEMGHLLGSPHTHSCAWNGNGTAIDNCAPSALGVDWEGGECMTTPPTIPFAEKGTIMSYCHLVPGVGISFSNGFGEQPSQRLVNTINSSNCLSTDCINTCINTVLGITFTNVTPTSATISWSDLGDTATEWEIAIMPYTASSGPYTTVSTTTFNTVAPLNPNTYYKVRIRPICENSTPPYRQAIFATSGDWCGGAVISDTGGINNNYADQQTFVRTLIPNLPGKKIRLDITEFDLEWDFDYLYIYSGSNVAEENLITTLTGTLGEQPSYTSTAVDGSMTLRFFSDQAVNEAGFVATVNCEQNLGAGNFTPNIDFTYYPNPTNGFVNINSNTEMSELTIHNVAGQLLYNNKINALDAQVDVSAFATGTYFFKLKFGEKEANFKIVKN